MGNRGFPRGNQGEEVRENGIPSEVYRFAYRKTCNSCNSCKLKRYTSGGIPFSWTSQAPLAPVWPPETPIWLGDTQL